tara:strand:+ start:3178 stop:3855 length:678 start_codon:yes stop_codon:yes gene_type:complete
MRNAQGNALFIILIGIVLFGALTFAMTENKTSNENIDTETARVTAAELLNYTNRLRQAALRMKSLKGCETEELSFEASPYNETNIYTQYPNSSSPEYKCYFFHAEGGGMRRLAAEDYQAETYKFTGSCRINNNVRGINFFLGAIPLETCEQINRMAGYNAPSYAPDKMAYSCTSQNFTGNFASSGVLPSINGTTEGCVEGTGGYTLGSSGSGDGVYWYFATITPE